MEQILTQKLELTLCHRQYLQETTNSMNEKVERTIDRQSCLSVKVQLYQHPIPHEFHPHLRSEEGYDRRGRQASRTKHGVRRDERITVSCIPHVVFSAY